MSSQLVTFLPCISQSGPIVPAFSFAVHLEMMSDVCISLAFETQGAIVRTLSAFFCG